MTARTVLAGEFSRWYLEVDGKGQELTLAAAVHGYANDLRAVGGLAGWTRWRLTALSLRYPEAQWALVAHSPDRVPRRLAGGFAVDPAVR